MYLDKLDGRVDAEFHDRLAAEWRREQSRILEEIGRRQSADKSYLEAGISLLDMARDAQRLFGMGQPIEKRALLNFVLSNSTWKNGELTATFRKPFDILAETTALAPAQNADEAGFLPPHPEWLPGPDSNQRPSG